jgi:hypothetical protein
MTEAIIWVVLGFFILVSLIDWRFKAIPSVLMTGMLFVVAFVSTVLINETTLLFGVLSFIFAKLISELDEHRGMADTKATVIIGFMLASWQGFIQYIVILIFLQMAYTFVMRTWIYKKGEFPFLPLYLIVYIILLISGGLL